MTRGITFWQAFFLLTVGLVATDHGSIIAVVCSTILLVGEWMMNYAERQNSEDSSK